MSPDEPEEVHIVQIHGEEEVIHSLQSYSWRATRSVPTLLERGCQAHKTLDVLAIACISSIP